MKNIPKIKYCNSINKLLLYLNIFLNLLLIIYLLIAPSIFLLIFQLEISFISV